jgi:hypothetical protein
VGKNPEQDNLTSGRLEGATAIHFSTKLNAYTNAFCMPFSLGQIAYTNAYKNSHHAYTTYKNAYRSKQVLNKNAYKNSHHGFKPTIEEYLKVQLPYKN